MWLDMLPVEDYILLGSLTSRCLSLLLDFNMLGKASNLVMKCDLYMSTQHFWHRIRPLNSRYTIFDSVPGRNSPGMAKGLRCAPVRDSMRTTLNVTAARNEEVF
jgi:hypothetical protein